MNKQLIAGIVILIVAVGLIVVTQKNKTDEMVKENSEDKMVQNAETEKSSGAENETEAMMTKVSPTEDEMMKKIDDAMMKNIASMQFTHSGILKDVAGGNSSGTASFSFIDGKYSMLATFQNLPELSNGDFYEGWLVQKNPFQFISTGKVEKVDGVYTNPYISGQDYSSYNFYVLTSEPNDGNPAPDKHIVEGLMTAK